jgi:outer membrane protein assembly factor BamB
MNTCSPRLSAVYRGTRFSLYVLMIVCACTVSSAQSQEWPRWRGSRGDGISSEKNWTPSALAGGAKILWTVDAGYGYSNVAIGGGRLYTMGTFRTGDTVLCLDAVTGADIWRRRVSDAPTPFMAMATPALDGEWLYVLFGDGTLASLRAADGSVRWSRNVLKDFGVEKLPYGCATSPVVEEDLLLLNFNFSGIAVKKHSGALAWASEPYGMKFNSEGYYATPVVVERTGVRCALFFGGTGLSLVEARSGKRFWTLPVVPTNIATCTDPVICGASVFVSSRADPPFPRLVAIEDGTPVWSGRLRTSFFTSVYLGGYLYGTDGDTRVGTTLQCVDAADGKLMWEHEMQAPCVTAAADKLILLEENGTLHIAEATPKGYHELASADALGGRDDVARKFWTPPVLVGGFMYCRNLEGQLVCVDLRAKR